MTILNKIGGWMLCMLGEHDWTSMAMEKPGHVPRHLHPGPGDSIEDIRVKFRAYARMYCRRCGKPSSFTT